jgi:putative ABC transport system permease protein
VVRSLDRDTPVDQPRSMEELIGGSVEGPRLAATLIGGFALAGLLLGAIGIYGTLSDVVTQRRREIGVRMALGAGRGDIYRAVLGGTLTVVATGAVAGIIGAAAAVRLFDAMLFGVAPADPVTFAVAVILLGITAAVAAFVPARRASTLDPLAILKVD